MAVTSNIIVDFVDCPICEEYYRMLVEILFNTADNIDQTLEDWGFNSNRNLGGITVVLPCGAACSFLWKRGLATIIGWTC